MRRKTYSLIVFCLLLFCITPLSAEEKMTEEELIHRFHKSSIWGEELLVSNELKLWQYEHILGEYKMLEDGLMTLEEVMDVLDKMIVQTKEKGEQADKRDEEDMTLTLGELEKMNKEGSNLDDGDVRVKTIHLEEDDVKQGVIWELEQNLPPEVKEQLPSNWQQLILDFDTSELPPEVKQVVDQQIQEYMDSFMDGNGNIPPFLYGVKVTIAIDSKAYYFKMILPELMNKLSEAKGTYEQLIRDQQVGIYTDMESVKFLNSDDSRKTLKIQENLKGQHKVIEIVREYKLLLEKVKLTEQKIEHKNEEIRRKNVEVSVGTQVESDISALELEGLILKQELKQYENQAQKLYLEITMGLGLVEEQVYCFELEPVIISEDISFKEFKSLVSKASTELQLIEKQMQAYDELQRLAEEVLREDSVEYQLISVQHRIKDTDYNQLISSIDLLIEKIYRDYESSKEYLVNAKASLGLSQSAYVETEKRYQQGTISKQDYEDEQILYGQQKVQYLEAENQYIEHRNILIRAIAGILPL